jgi:GT2 family glycosyltransferase
MEKVMPKDNVRITVSIVSHGQMAWVQQLLTDLNSVCADSDFEVILTLNQPEETTFELSDFYYPLHVLRNAAPVGFASNHNRAFERAGGQYFCVVNPDIRMKTNPFPALLECLKQPGVGVAAPMVRSAAGALEDSFRRFPNPAIILCKALGHCRGADYEVGNTTIYPDWAGGMFLLFPSPLFRALHGFDHRYFLYYEDVDICARLRVAGYRVAVSPAVSVVHDAQRASHVHWKYRRWHLESMVRFFLSPAFIRGLWSMRTKSPDGGAS